MVRFGLLEGQQVYQAALESEHSSFERKVCPVRSVSLSEPLQCCMELVVHSQLLNANETDRLLLLLQPPGLSQNGLRDAMQRLAAVKLSKLEDQVLPALMGTPTPLGTMLPLSPLPLLLDGAC